MATQLHLDDHLDALGRSGALLREAAAQAGLQATVPTCPGWDVSELVAHQSMVHRWAAANLRGEKDYVAEAALDEAKTVPDLLVWYFDGLSALIDTVHATPDDAEAMVFLKNAPPPRQFWARRQAHETTIHSVDAIAARIGRQPAQADVSIDPELAADGIDELVSGFITRRSGRLRSEVPFTLGITTDDTPHAWTLRVSDGPVETTVGEATSPDAAFSGTAAQIYLGLWNRGNEMIAEGRPDVLDQWRAQVQVSWS